MLIFRWPLTVGLRAMGYTIRVAGLAMSSLSLADAFGEGERGKLVFQLKPFEDLRILGERLHQAGTRLGKAERGPEEPREIVRRRVAVEQPHGLALRLVALGRELDVHLRG